MKKMNHFFITVLFLFTSQAAFADSKTLLISGANNASNRFILPLQTLSQLFTSSTSLSTVVDTLLHSSTARPAAFTLQGLSKLYEDTEDTFKTIRQTSKEIEDLLGDFDKWNSALQKAVEAKSNSKTIEALQQKTREATEALTQYTLKNSLMDSKKSPLQKYIQFIQSTSFGSEKEDQKYIEKTLQNMVENITEDLPLYDLSRLERRGPGENKKGLHELRRTIRWFAIIATATKGAISLRPVSDRCPLPTYQKLVEEPLLQSFLTNKYTQLEEPASGQLTCALSRCLFYQVANLIKDLGDLKDLAETKNLITDPTGKLDTVPADLTTKAQTILKEIKKYELFETIADELKSCRKNR